MSNEERMRLEIMEKGLKRVMRKKRLIINKEIIDRNANKNKSVNLSIENSAAISQNALQNLLSRGNETFIQKGHQIYAYNNPNKTMLE